MDAWRQLDDFHDRVVNIPVVEFAPGPFSSLGEARVAHGTRAPDRLVVRGWELFLSRRRQGGAVFWHLSAKFSSRDRPPSPNDWEDIRRIAARVGALPFPPLVARGPRVMAHWTWRDL